MGDGRALRTAIVLVYLPSLVRKIRSEPLPEGVVLLLRIASGDPEAEHQAAALCGRTVNEIRDAAVFFIEQVLLHPNADSYRVLGANPLATNHELRRNMVLLLKWLHPDLNRQNERSICARRVTTAWNDLKTADRRSAYDKRMLSICDPALVLRSHSMKTRRYLGAPGGPSHDVQSKGTPIARGQSRVARLLKTLSVCFHRRRYC
jgi:hypothetical protein